MFFTTGSTVFQPYQNNEWVIMIGSVHLVSDISHQRNSSWDSMVQSWEY